MARLFAAFLLACAMVPGAASAVQVAAGPSAELRGLDRLTGKLTDLTLGVGETIKMDRLNISLVECRYPTANPSGDAYAYLLIDDIETGTNLFSGWMLASSPALNALDHSRYDVWVLRCNNS